MSVVFYFQNYHLLQFVFVYLEGKRRRPAIEASEKKRQDRKTVQVST